MTLKEFAFQNNAVNKLYEAFIAGNKNIILQAPTGSGKTIILIKLIDVIAQHAASKLAFVWLTPGAGELEEQSWKKSSSMSENVRPQFLKEALHNGFSGNTITFLNWELVNNKKKKALREGESSNLRDIIAEAKREKIKFILIVDEEHKNQTSKSQDIISMFDAECIYRASATPIKDDSAHKITVSEEDVISEGLITKNVVINDQFNEFSNSNDTVSNGVFLRAAYEKRLLIKDEYNKLNKDINPLVLIQFPDDKRNKDIRKSVNNQIEEVKKFLINNLHEAEDNIAEWLSGRHINVDNVSDNNSNVDFLLMKQAVSTGWDVPRAKILVKLRLNTERRFTIQTIGRIRRMPEQHHYGVELLDNSYVYSNDDEYVSEIVKEGLGSGITQMSLRDGISPDLFNVTSEKVSERKPVDVFTTLKRLREQFVKEYDLTNNPHDNKEKLNDYGFVFGTNVKYNIPTGKVSSLSEINTLSRIPQNGEIVHTRDWGYAYDNALLKLKPYLHVGDNLRYVRSIVSDLIANTESGSGLDQILRLNPRERYAFVINNIDRLCHVAKEMDINSPKDTQEVSFLPENVPFLLPKKEGYLDTGDKNKKKFPLKKNVYDHYTQSNWVKQTRPERLFEKAVERIDCVKYIYRSKDKGSKYFSIVYNGMQRDFFPDYLIKTTYGTTLIIETKGGQNENIDEYAALKFDALKAYVQRLKHSMPKIKLGFAFVRPINSNNDTLVYSNSEWSDEVSGKSNWKPLINLFKEED